MFFLLLLLTLNFSHMRSFWCLDLFLFLFLLLLLEIVSFFGLLACCMFIAAVLGGFSLLAKFKVVSVWFSILVCMYISASCCCAITIGRKLGVWESVVLFLVVVCDCMFVFP